MNTSSSGTVTPVTGYSYTILIPARMASSRLPGKPLSDIAGKPMVVRVAERVSVDAGNGMLIPRVVVAGDDPQIIAACHEHGIEAVLTAVTHASGSDRLAEACSLLGLPDDGIVVNVQGDEPLMDPALPAAVASLLMRHADASMSTAAHALTSWQEFTNPNIVKVVCDARGMALYFSRAPIPWWRDCYGTSTPTGEAPQLSSAPAPLRHIGIYGYRVNFLKSFAHLPPAPLETCEALEQLRALWHGHRIAVHVSHDAPGIGVDTPEDLEAVRRIWHGMPPSRA